MTDNIQQIFNQIAPVYDQLNDWLSVGLHRVWKLTTVKFCEPTQGDLALDLCCGSGDLALLLAEIVGDTGLVHGIDFASCQLEIARDRAQKHYPPLLIEWVEADVLRLPFPDNYFDCATMGYGLRNVKDIPLALQEIHRVLKPKAKIAILDMHRPSDPLMKSFQEFYLKQIVVPIADSFGLKSEYAYIQPSLDKFPTGTEQKKLAYQAGFTKVTHYEIALGMMGILVAQKSDARS